MLSPEGHQRRTTLDPAAIAGNIRAWTRTNAEHTDERAESSWREEDITWGVFNVSEVSLNSPLGIVGIEFPLIEAPAEQVPLLDATFDLAVSEYGASLWADPVLWVPEAARLLRPGGRLVFLTNSTLVYLCSPDEGLVSAALQRPQFGMYRIKWPDDSDGTEYHLSHGDWIRLLRANGFEIEDLIEVQAPQDAESPVYYDYVTAEWGRQWPAEEIWVARKRS